MLRTILSAALLLVVPVSLAAQETLEALGEDLVVIEGDSLMVITSYRLDKLTVPGYTPIQLQVAQRATAPINGPVSRDYFVMLNSLVGYTMTQAMLAGSVQLTAAQFLDAYDSEDLDQLIGQPDVSIDVTVALGGLQIAITNHSTGESQRSTQTWAEFMDN